MKSTHTIAIGVFTALSLGLAASAQAETAGPGMPGSMMQGQGAGGHGGMAGHPGQMGSHEGAKGPQHGAAGAGPAAGGCPMMSMMSQQTAPGTTQK